MDARYLAGLHRHGPDVAAAVALRSQSARPTIRCARFSPQSIDFDRLARSPIKLFITATSVRTGRGRIFRNAEITRRRAARLGLSADDVSRRSRSTASLLGRRICRQSDHHAADPRKRCARHDPGADQSARTAGTPRSAAEILNRLNEISFNSPLMKELRMIALLRQVADPGTRRRRALGADADPPDHDRHAGAVRRLLEAQCRMGIRHHVARRGSPRRRANFSRSTASDLGERSTADLDVLLAEC